MTRRGATTGRSPERTDCPDKGRPRCLGTPRRRPIPWWRRCRWPTCATRRCPPRPSSRWAACWAARRRPPATTTPQPTRTTALASTRTPVRIAWSARRMSTRTGCVTPMTPAWGSTVPVACATGRKSTRMATGCPIATKSAAAWTPRPAIMKRRQRMTTEAVATAPA